jgi:ribonuclease P protein component
MDESLGKEFKLCSKKAIDRLFKDGKSFRSESLRFVYFRENSSVDELKILFVVSKRNFKRAVDRNLLKRRMREAFRKNKTILYHESQNTSKHLHVGILYGQNKIMSFKEIEVLMTMLDQKLKTAHE